MASFSTTYMIKDEKTSPRKPMYIVVMSSYNKMVEHQIIISFYNGYKGHVTEIHLEMYVEQYLSMCINH